MSDWAKAYLPHTPQAVYGCTILCALVFALIATLLTLWRDKEFLPMHTITQAGSGAMFPVFATLPFVPFDRDLMDTLYQSWVTVAMAGLLGMGVTLYGLFASHSRFNPYTQRRNR